MIEAHQFVMWIFRKLFKLPKRWYNRLLECYEYGDWAIPVSLVTIGVGIVGVTLGMISSVIFNDAVASLACLIVWVSGLGFILTAGVHALYLVFKQEQQELIDTLKRNG